MRALETLDSSSTRSSTAPDRPAAALPSTAGPPGAGSGPVVLSSEGRLKVVVGLGNPGSQYAGTRHNIGWLVMDRLAERAGWTGKGRQRDASNVVMGRFRGLDLTLVKPLTYMNESGLAVRKVLARDTRAAGRPADRRRRLRAAVRQAALPRGRRPGRSQRPALDHRRARDREVQPAPDRDRRAGPQRRRPRPHEVRARRAAAARRAPRRRRRRGRGMGARGDEQGRQPLQHVRAAARPIRRGSPPRARSTARPTPTASAGRRPAGAGSGRRSRTPERARHAAPRPARPRPPDRRAGRDRLRGAPRADAADHEVDFDVAAVDAEVEDARRRAAEAAAPSRAARTATKRCGRAGRKGGGHRLPGPLGAAAAARRDRHVRRPARAPGTRRATTRRRTGRHVGLVSVPHGAKSYLAAALAQVAGGERLVWVARDAEIGDRVAEELGAWLGDPEAVAVLEPRTALAYERSELIADETAARVAALAAWRSGRARILVAGVQALLQHTIAPADLPLAPRELRLGSRLHQDALLRELFDLGYVPVSEVAGRGESRGAAASSTSSRRRCRCRSGSSSSATRSTPCARSTRPTSERSARSTRRPAAGVGVPAAGRRWRRDPRSPRPGRRAPPGAPGRGPRPVRRGTARAWPAAARDGDPGGGRRRRRGGLGRPPRPGDRPRPHRSGHPPRARRAGRHRRGRRVPVAPGRRAPRGAGRGRRAAEGLAVDLPAAARLEGPARRVADARADLGVGATRGRRDGPRRRCRRATRSAGANPVLPPGRAGRLAEAVEAWRGRRRPDRPRLGPGAAARRPAGRGRPPGRGRRAGRRGAAARRDRARSSGASTAASSAARTASPSSPIASCSGPSASGGRGRCGGSSRATSSSG